MLRAANDEREFDRAAMKRAILDKGGLPQAELDQITDHAIAAIKRYGSASEAARQTKMENPIWDRAYQAALRATDAKEAAN